MTPPATYEALASALNYTLLDSQLSNSQVLERLAIARRCGAGMVTVRPSDMDLAVRDLQGSAVRPGSVVSYPYGFQNTAVKLYEARDLLRRGAREIGLVIAISRLLSREFQHIQTELNQMTEACRGEGARLTVLLDTVNLSDELKIIACTCCERAEVDFVCGAMADFHLLRKHLPDETGIQASDAADLDSALELLGSGYSRLATTAAAPILDAWKQRLAPAESAGS
jgi:deoxyribose-phosphate aldolase